MCKPEIITTAFVGHNVPQPTQHQYSMSNTTQTRKYNTGFPSAPNDPLHPLELTIKHPMKSQGELFMPRGSDSDMDVQQQQQKRTCYTWMQLLPSLLAGVVHSSWGMVLQLLNQMVVKSATVPIKQSCHIPVRARIQTIRIA